MFLGLLTVLLLAFVIYLDRRVRKLELLVAGDAQSFETEYDDLEPAPASTSERSFTADEEPEVSQHSAPVEYEGILEAAEDPREWRLPKLRLAISVEDLFGRRLPIWAGGITLAVAGFFIVKLSIEAGLLSPSVRVVGGMIFGGALISGAELALRFHDRVRDPRVRQALSGAGLASLYASILVATNLYHLIHPAIAMVGLAAVTGAAILLSIRFGAPSALLGLAGGLAAPALIGSANPNIPLLTLYLAAAVTGLSVLSRGQRWAWLAISALTGGFIWGAVLLASGTLDMAGSGSVGMYLLLISVGLPLLSMGSEHGSRLQLVAAIAGAAEIAALVASGGYSMLDWGLFGTIATAIAWLGTRERILERLPLVSLAVALLLAGWWPAPGWQELTLVLAGVAAIHAPIAARRVWSDRGHVLDAAQVALLGLGVWVVAMIHFNQGHANDVPLGLLALSLALSVGGLAALGWHVPERQMDSRFVIVTSATGVLLASASKLLLPDWCTAAAIGAVGFALVEVGIRAGDRRLEPTAWIFAAVAFAVLLGELAFSSSWRIDSLRLALNAIVAASFAWRGRQAQARALAQFVAAMLVYFALAPWFDLRVRPAVGGMILFAAAYAGRYLRSERLLPAIAAALVIVVGWAIPALAQWVSGATVSLIGEPLLVGSVPSVESGIGRLLVPGGLLAAGLYISAGRLRSLERVAGAGVAILLIGVGVHALYKHAFAISGGEAFVRLGLMERTVWETALFAGAIVAARFGRKETALAFSGVALFHFAAYSLLLHNALWAAQAVGPLPILNLLLVSYGMANTALVMLARTDGLADHWLRPIAVAEMVLVSLLAFSELRQLFHGSLLVVPGLGEGEDIARSILAIAVAVGFLLWGISRQNRDWRIGSLILMVAAVAKVFLFDASGLEGVIRIASFVALGFSLIGIGWLYSRFLPLGDPEGAEVRV
jgi:uncharacterized membrane protein